MSRSRGAVMFAQLGHTQAVLSVRLGVSTGIVAMWNSGQRKPGLANRKLLLEKFKIPIEAWDEEPTRPHDPPSSSRPAAPAWGENTVTGQVEGLERFVANTLERVRTDTELSPLEQAKCMSLLTSSLERLRRLKGEAATELQVLKHAKWLEVKSIVLTALEAHPDALDSVIDALQDLERESA